LAGPELRVSRIFRVLNCLNWCIITRRIEKISFYE
jgi:hypothetical protein